MKRERVAYFLHRFNNYLIYFLTVFSMLILSYFAQQLYQNTQAIKKIAQSNERKLDEVLPIPFPLKFDTPQNVLREPPVFHLNEPIDVEARFLNETDQVITLSADVHWVLLTEHKDMIEPIQVGLFITIKPGCTKIPFSNQRPLAVSSLTKKLFGQGHQRVTWKLEGTNQIIAPYPGGKQKFEVDEFSYIPDSQPIPPGQIDHIPDTCEGL